MLSAATAGWENRELRLRQASDWRTKAYPQPQPDRGYAIPETMTLPWACPAPSSSRSLDSADDRGWGPARV